MESFNYGETTKKCEIDDDLGYWIRAKMECVPTNADRLVKDSWTGGGW
jgi:hypothetical protein